MSMPKSKESRRKTRRWSFDLHLTQDGQTRKLPSGRMCIGNSRLARDLAAGIQKDVAALPQMEGTTVTVHPVSHETISEAIVSQINGLNGENQLLIEMLKDLVREDLIAKGTPEPTDEEVSKLLGERAGAKRAAQFAAKQAEAEAAAAQMGGEAVVLGPDGLETNPADPDNQETPEGVVPGPTFAEEQAPLADPFETAVEL